MLRIPGDHITVVTAAAAEPITRTEAKLWAKIEITEDDDLVDALIETVRASFEAETSHVLVQKTVKVTVRSFADAMDLPLHPVQSISHIKYYDTSSPSALTTLDSGVYSLVNGCIFRNSGEAWPSVYPREDAIEIQFVVGYATDDSVSPADNAGNVPPAAKTAMKAWLADLYVNRETQIIGTISTPNETIKRLLQPLRVYR